MARIITKTTAAAPSLPRLKKVAAYARVSCGKDEMLHSLAAQVSFYSDYIQRHPDWEYAGVYADVAVTGTTDKRPEFQRLIKDCNNGKIDLVLTKSISRFARNTVDLLETVRELKGLGVNIFFEEQNIHTQSGDGELILTILASYAQEESRSVSENQKWRIRKNFKEGKPSNSIRVYGYEYRNENLTVIPEEAEVVRMIYSDFLSGMGRNAIMKKLLRIAAPTKNGGDWSESSVSSILSNEKYIGDMRLQKGFIADHLTKRWKRNSGELPQYYIEGNHEPIVSREVYEAVQEEIARRAEKANRPRKPAPSEFTGIIRCHKCGANFRRKTSGAGTKYAKVIWICGTFAYHGKAFCGAKRIPEDILKVKCAEALGLPEYDPGVFQSKVRQINVPEDGVLVFVFNDGAERTVVWENRPRSESWTDEMKNAARLRTKGGADNA